MTEKERLRLALSLAAEHYRAHGRMLPWRRDREAYHVFLSEIMLQQTRVEAVIPYYEKFLSLFPTVRDLAAADEEVLLKAWEGLGYYSRARNLHRAAKCVTELYGGVFPADFDALLALPGVGRYTAGAIASLSFGLPRAAVDGNAIRIYTRLFADGRTATDERFKREITEAFDAVYPSGDGARDTTQGLMEVGQCFCLPVGAPRCDGCPLCALCAVGKGEADFRLFPHKEKKKPRKILPRTVLLLTDGTRFFIRRRPKTGLLAGLWEFPSTDGHKSPIEAVAEAQALGFRPTGVTEASAGKHIFTHLEWHMQGYLITVAPEEVAPFTAVTVEEIRAHYPIASAFRTFFDYIDEQRSGGRADE